MALFEKFKGCGSVRENVSLKVDFDVSKAYTKPKVSFFLCPADLDVELSTTSLATCMPACCYASYHDDNLTISKCQLIPVHLKVVMAIVSLP